MSYLLFLDESGHDHRTMPYEVRGGIAVHASEVWSFVQKMRNLEKDAFGDYLFRYGAEVKGAKLLDKDRFRWANQSSELMPDDLRRMHAQAFLERKIVQATPTRDQFTAYGQSSLYMADGIFRLLREHSARIFAVAIPRGASKPPPNHAPEFLRKDLVYLLERYCYFVQENSETGLIVMDETERSHDRRLMRQIERYFSLTQVGRERARCLIPIPFFGGSDMIYPVQAADVCIYALNWSFRLTARGMSAPVRQDLADRYAGQIGALQWRGTRQKQEQEIQIYGIAYVPDLYTSRSL